MTKSKRSIIGVATRPVRVVPAPEQLPMRTPNQVQTALPKDNLSDGWAARGGRLIDSCSPSRNELSQHRIDIFSRTFVRVATRNHRQNNWERLTLSDVALRAPLSNQVTVPLAQGQVVTEIMVFAHTLW